jgi:hypothetical protein
LFAVAASSGSTSNSAMNSARRPPGLGDLDIPFNRSTSSSDRNLLSALALTDKEGGFFSATASFFDASGRDQNAVGGADAAYLNAQLQDCTQATHQLTLSDPRGAVAHLTTAAVANAGARPVSLNTAAKLSSQLSVSSIGDDSHDEDGDEFPENDDLLYSAAASPMKQTSANSGVSFGVLSSESSGMSFNLDTSFMLSPQNSGHSLDNSPFASQSFDSFRGRPPAGVGISPHALTANNLQGMLFFSSLVYTRIGGF